MRIKLDVYLLLFVILFCLFFYFAFFSCLLTTEIDWSWLIVFSSVGSNRTPRGV